LEIVEHFLSQVPKSNILEIGCGNGNPMAAKIFASKLSYKGIDISEKQIKMAK